MKAWRKIALANGDLSAPKSLSSAKLVFVVELVVFGVSVGVEKSQVRYKPATLGVKRRELKLKRSLLRGSNPSWSNNSGDVAQLVRALPCHGRGRGFEPRRPRHTFQRTYGMFGT